MSTGREIRSYDYVNRPYERVRDALRQNALTVFQSATKAAASRAQSIAAELHVSTTTVKTHMRNLYAKLDAHSRAEAVASARGLGLLAPSASVGRT